MSIDSNEQRSETTWGKCVYILCVSFCIQIAGNNTRNQSNWILHLFIFFSLTITIILFYRIIINYTINNKYEAFNPCLSCCWFLRFRGTTKIHCKYSWKKERRMHFAFPFFQLQYINSVSSAISIEPIGRESAVYQLECYVLCFVCLLVWWIWSFLHLYFLLIRLCVFNILKKYHSGIKHCFEHG